MKNGHHGTGQFHSVMADEVENAFNNFCLTAGSIAWGRHYVGSKAHEFMTFSAITWCAHIRIVRTPALDKKIETTVLANYLKFYDLTHHRRETPIGVTQE